MSGRWQGQDLLQPITTEQPCGEDLEDTHLLASFDAFRVFGQQAGYAEDRPPAWTEIRSKALEALARSKDLRFLTHLGASALRTDGFAAFAETLTATAAWLETYWAQVYPRVDDDAVIRKNALNCFADPAAIVDAVRRLPLVASRQHGTFSLRDLDIVAGLLKPVGSEAPDGSRIDAAFAEMPLEELRALHAAAAAAAAAIKAIEGAMLKEGGIDAVPGLDPLAAQLLKMERALGPRLAARGDVVPGDDGAPETATAAGTAAAVAVGAIASRQDAIRALDAVADFFRRTEPSSPVPMFVERAKRLVSKSFLEVLADVAPDAVSQAMHAGGVTGTQGE